MKWIIDLLRRKRIENELDEEIKAHVDLETQQRLEAGDTAEAARSAALRDFGNVALVKEVTRQSWGWTSVERLRQDVRYALRTMWRTPALTMVAVLSLALGIGANTAIFSLVDAVLLKMLPVKDPEQLIELLTVRGSGRGFNAFSYQALDSFRTHTRTLEGVAGSSNTRFYMRFEGGDSQRVFGQYVTGDYFTLLGVRTILGRPIEPADADAVAVLSYASWQSRFASDPSVIGKTLIIDGAPFTLVGVAAPEFYGTQVGSRTDLWVPLAIEPRMRRPSWTSSAGYKWIQLIGRRKAETSFEEARAELEVLFRQAVIEVEAPLFPDVAAQNKVKTWRLAVEPAGAGLSQLRSQFSKPLLILMFVVCLVLLIACANVANLLLARAAAREREIAIRKSIGAGRARLIRQLLTESLVLAALGGMLGLLFAGWGSQYLVGFLASGRMPVHLNVQPDARLLAFTAFVAVLTGVLFGLIPALRASNADLSLAMKGGAAKDSGSARGLASRALVAGQMALLIVLIVGAGLFLKSLRNLNSIQVGFQHDHVLLLQLDPSQSGYSPDRLRSLYAELIGRFEALPGIKSASLCWLSPITGGGSNRTVELDAGQAGRQRISDVYINWVAPKYFATLGIPLIAGRDFSLLDSHEAARVAIINQVFARRHFGGADPIGKRIDGVEIVGVVGDTKYLELREETPNTIFLSTFQNESPGSQFVVRTSGDPLKTAPAMRREVQTLAKGIAILEPWTLTQQVNASIVQERLLATLAACFGGLALLLAALGLYGVIGYRVVRRTKEFGIRTALGAVPADIIGMVLRETALVVSVGIALGVPLALILSRFVKGLLYGLTPTDPIVISVSILALSIVAILAGFLPARRAARVDPMTALRYE